MVRWLVGIINALWLFGMCDVNVYEDYPTSSGSSVFRQAHSQPCALYRVTAYKTAIFNFVLLLHLLLVTFRIMWNNFPVECWDISLSFLTFCLCRRLYAVAVSCVSYWVLPAWSKPVPTGHKVFFLMTIIRQLTLRGLSYLHLTIGDTIISHPVSFSAWKRSPGLEYASLVPLLVQISQLNLIYVQCEIDFGISK